MKTPLDTKRFSRRDFLRLAGLTAGGLMTQTLIAPAGAARAFGGLSPGLGGGRVGVLLPASTRYPALRNSFLAGLQLAAEGRAQDLVVRETGAGTGNAYETAQQLLNKEGVRQIVGMFDELTLTHLRRTLEARQATVLAVSLGENLSRLTKADSRVTAHGLDLAQSAAAFGAWAARSLGRTAVLVASSYDSGYDAFAAFRFGFENAGGQVRSTVITHQPDGGPDVAAAMRTIAAIRPDFVYAAYCGSAAVEWVRAYRQAGLGSIPLAGSPFLADGTLLAAHGDAARGILTVQPLAVGGDKSGPAGFAGAYQARYGRQADLLALLGYETARLMAGQAVDSRVIAIHEVQQQGASLVNTMRQTLSMPGANDQALAALRSQVHSGWLYPYLGS
jgi:branched-chain amino acid transport system substrate-binding protein